MHNGQILSSLLENRLVLPEHGKNRRWPSKQLDETVCPSISAFQNAVELASLLRCCAPLCLNSITHPSFV